MAKKTAKKSPFKDLGKSRKKVVGGLPAGFKRPEFAPAWKPHNVGDFLQGVMHRTRTLKVNDQDTGGKRNTQIYTIRTETGFVDVWEATGLADLGRVGAGQEVYIEYTGEKDVGRESPVKLYIVGVR